MSNGINLTLEQYKDKDLPLTITINGHTYYSQYALATAQTTWFEMGKAIGIEEGKKANGYSSDDIKQLHTDMNHIHHLWYDKGYNAGKSEGYKEGYDDASIKYLNECADKSKNRYDDGYNDGYEQCKHDNKNELKANCCNHGECIAGKEEEYEKGYKEGYEFGVSLCDFFQRQRTKMK